VKKQLGLAAVMAAATLGIGMSRLAAPALAGGGCNKCDASGWWAATQSNGYQFRLYLTQDGAIGQNNSTGLAGTYFFDDWQKGNYKPASARLPLSGTVSYNQIDFTTGQAYKTDDVFRATGVYSTQGHYTGTIQDYNIINGQADDVVNPGHSFTWSAYGGPSCAG
jgi:hypothetical protein